MRYLFYALRALIVSMKNVFGPTVTEFAGRPETDRGERFRTSFALLYEDEVLNDEGEVVSGRGEERCIACSKCASVCPSGIIEVVAGPKGISKLTGKKRGYLEDYSIDMTACIYCELCVQVCPTDALTMVATHHPPVFFREDLVLTRERLYSNGDEAKLSWAKGSLLTQMQDPERGAPPKAPKTPKVAKAPREVAPAPVSTSAEAEAPAVGEVS